MTCKLLTIDMGPIQYVNPKVIETTMANKPTSNTETNSQIPEEFKDPNLKYNLSKFEYDLYHEEDDVQEKIIRVKRFSLPNNGERWKIFEDTKAVFVIEGAKLTKKEREFLQTVEGMSFVITQYKLGINSFNHFKTELKKKIK